MIGPITSNRRCIAIAAIAVLVALAGCSAPLGTASAETAVEFGELHADDVDETVGQLDDIQIEATIKWEFEAQEEPDHRIVALTAGEPGDERDMIDSNIDTSPGFEDSGTVTVSGSLFDVDGFDAEYFADETREVEIAAELRLGGIDEDETVTETVTIDVTEDGEFVMNIGGEVTIDVEDQNG